MNYKTLSNFAVLSIIGAGIMLIGDFLFFLTPWVDGENFNSIDAMRTMSKQRLMFGGILGPIAGVVYGAGSCLYYVALKEHNKVLAIVITALSVFTYSLAGAAHSLFTVNGFSQPTISVQLGQTIGTMIAYMSVLIMICAVLSTVLLVYMILRYKTVFPKWTILVLPITLSAIEPVIQPLIPSPLGSIIIGGWPNWSAVIFSVVLVVIWRKQIRGDNV